MPFRNRVMTMLKIFRNANGDLALWIKGGPNSIGFGQAVIQLFSGSSSEQLPGEISTIADGPLPTDNISLFLMAPKKVGYSDRALLQLYAQDSDTGATAILHGEFVTLGADSIAYINADKIIMTGSDTISPASLIALSGPVQFSNGTAFTGLDKGRQSLTSNASGQVTISHSLGVSPAIAMVTLEGSLLYDCIVVARSSTTITVQLMNGSTRAAVGAGISPIFSWLVVA